MRFAKSFCRSPFTRACQLRWTAFASPARHSPNSTKPRGWLWKSGLSGWETWASPWHDASSKRITTWSSSTRRAQRCSAQWRSGHEPRHRPGRSQIAPRRSWRACRRHRRRWKWRRGGGCHRGHAGQALHRPVHRRQPNGGANPWPAGRLRHRRTRQPGQRRRQRSRKWALTLMVSGPRNEFDVIRTHSNPSAAVLHR